MTAPTTPDLLPCPFCGGTEIFIEPDERGSGGQWISPFHVGCSNCKCAQSAFEQDEAVTLWNTRASLDAEQPSLERAVFEAAVVAYASLSFIGKLRPASPSLEAIWVAMEELLESTTAAPLAGPVEQGEPT